MTLQTGNALLLIRCFTKYIIEIENEAALLEQLNIKHTSPQSDSGHASDSLKSQPPNQPTDMSSSSSNASPKRNISTSANNKNRYTYRDYSDSLEESAENDSDPDLTINSSKSHDENILFQLIRHLFELCIEVPVE
jgi:hypothetical protein